MSEPEFTLGIEEEYLVVDADSMDLSPVPESMLKAAEERLEGRVSPEFRDCMIEVATRVSADVAEAREDLAWLRTNLSEIASDHGLAVLAVSCHPYGLPEQRPTGPRQRYDDIAHDIGGLARRLMTCGMHVHVGVGDDDELRIDLMRQFVWFLPMVLALSASSPFWKGEDTALASWRLSVFDTVPRSRLPPDFVSWAEYRKGVDVLTGAGIIEDASKIWWDMRPSEEWPTLEVRIADVMPRLDETVAVAALIQSAMRMLWRLNQRHMRWRTYDRFLVEENRWRAQRYGTEAVLLDFASGKLEPLADIVAETVDLLSADAAALHCATELRHALDIVTEGGSATRQRRIVDEARKAGADEREALRHLLRVLVAEFRPDRG